MVARDSGDESDNAGNGEGDMDLGSGVSQEASK